MSVFPHSRFFISPTRSVVISGPHIQVLETQTGNVLYSTARLEDAQKATFLKSGPVRCATVDAACKYVVTSGEDKQLKVWEVEGLKLMSERELPKKPTNIHLTRDGQNILVSDKFGDIFSYPLQPELVAETAFSTEAGSSKRGTLSSHENSSNGKLILGHTSLLTTFLLTEDEKYVVSADRDEHIRVSWFPQGYVVERYCLGHRKYVSAIHIPSFSPSTLLSGGGDSTIKLWDWMSGEQLADIPIGDVVEKYIRVKAPKGHAEDGHGDKQLQDEKPGKRKGRGRRNRGKGKQVTQEDAEEGTENTVVYVEGETDDVAVQTEATENSTKTIADALVELEQADASTTTGEESLVLALQRIESLGIPDAGNFVVFNAVGATALYTFKMPSLPVKQTDFVINALDLEKPIIDFTIDENGYIWVLVDGERQITSTAETENKRSVRLIRWQGSKFAEVDEPIDVAPLLTSLNTTCLIPATAADMKTLDIYSALVSLPKNVDAEHDPMRQGAYDDMEPDTPDVDEEGSSRGVTPQPGAKKGKTREPTQRELARAKKMDAVRAKMQEQNQAKNVGLRPTPEGEPDAKKVRAEETEGTVKADVVMAESS